VQGNQLSSMDHRDRCSREGPLVNSSLQDLKSAMELFVLISERALWRRGDSIGPKNLEFAFVFGL